MRTRISSFMNFNCSNLVWYTQSKMLSLGIAAVWTKKIAVGLVIFIMAVIVIRALVSFGISVRNKYFPQPPPPPDERFGRLPQITFENDSKKLSIGASVKIDTIDGTLGKFPTVARVFSVDEPVQTLTSLSRAKTQASSLGFEGEPTAISSNVFRWHNSLSQTLNIDIQNGSINLSTDPAKLASNKVLDSNSAVNFALDFLKRNNLNHQDLDDKSTSTAFVKATGNYFTVVSSKQDANITEVDFQRQIEGLSNKTYDLTEEEESEKLVSIGVSQNPDTQENTTVSLSYYYWPIDPGNSGIYKIKTVNQALEDLKAGKGHIINLPGPGSTTITDVSLSYFVNHNFQKYLQPVFVFRGDDGFFAVVEATVY